MEPYVGDSLWKLIIDLQAHRTPALRPNIGLSWFRALEQEFKKPYFKEISLRLKEEKSTVYPPLEKIYDWTRHCDIRDVKVVIIDQDPYPGEGQANGLAFSVPIGFTIPPSLANMYKVIIEDYPDFIPPKHGYLKGWATQGVLLLNETLTVKADNPKSHEHWGWTTFTNAVIRWLSLNLSNIVFLLWGSFATKKAELIDVGKHAVFTSSHPCPISVHDGFFGCQHFVKANNYLIKNGKTPIDWGDLPFV